MKIEIKDKTIKKWKEVAKKWETLMKVPHEEPDIPDMVEELLWRDIIDMEKDLTGDI